MKLIDILNKIANGELKEGTKVIYKGEVYAYQKDAFSPKEYDLYVEDRLITIFDNCHLSNVNDEVELIEPDHFREDTKMIEPTDNTKIEELDVNALTWNDLLDYQKLEILFDKLNEVIRKINKEE